VAKSGWLKVTGPDASIEQAEPLRGAISVVAGARNHLQANRSLGFRFEIPV